MCEIDESKLQLPQDAAKVSEENRFICVSEELNLWYVSLHLPHYLKDKRHRPTKRKIEENNNAKLLYRRVLDEGALIRILDLDWPLGYDEDETTTGQIRHIDSPFVMYVQDYNAQKPFERMLNQDMAKCVTFDQLPQEIKENILRKALNNIKFKSCRI